MGKRESCSKVLNRRVNSASQLLPHRHSQIGGDLNDLAGTVGVRGEMSDGLR